MGAGCLVQNPAGPPESLLNIERGSFNRLPLVEVPNNTDATADFYTALSDPTRWVIKPGVPVFKPHERTDPATGALIKVDIPKLQRIAANMQRMERQGGVPIRMTLGHTEPGKPETQQPPVGGYYRNARVATFGPKGEPAIVVDEWLDPQYANVRKNFPYRSAEYYDDAEQITGVALLTRDPYLDLGVVAYGRVSSGAGASGVHYARTVDRAPTMYHFLTTGDVQMFPNGIPPVVPTPAAPVPQQHATPIQAIPDNYAGINNPAAYSAPWPGPQHQRQNIGHQHQSGGAIYANPQQQRGQNPIYGRGQRPGNRPPGRYADDDGGAPPPDMGGGGGEQDALQTVHQCLTQAVEALSQLIGAGGGAGGPPAPQSPFPPEEGGGGPPDQFSRYRRPQYPRRNPRNYSTDVPQPPQPGDPMRRTISGMPVGYQMKIDQLQYQLNQSNEALKLLYYERDQADTQWCVAEIRRLASMGYQVGEYEIGELKSKPVEHRDAYLGHIMSRYQRIGTEMAPPILGDPTPGPVENQNRPASREEMEAALKLTSQNPQLDYNSALMYARQGGTVPHNRISGAPAGVPNQWNDGAPAPEAFGDPYPEPGLNGHWDTRNG